MPNPTTTYRLLGHRLVSGWLQPSVIDALTELDAAQRAAGVEGPVAEIGVHHGRLFIPLSLTTRPDEIALAIDLFHDQLQNVDQSGKGDRARFEANLRRWSSMDSVVVHQGDSTSLTPSQVQELAGGPVRFFSIDGGHTSEIVLSDMRLAEKVLVAGGVVIADDVFNEQWPGVVQGTFEYLTTGGKLVPFAVGFNKTFFTTAESAAQYRQVLQARFDRKLRSERKKSGLFGHEVEVLVGTRATPKRAVLAVPPLADFVRSIRR